MIVQCTSRLIWITRTFTSRWDQSVKLDTVTSNLDQVNLKIVPPRTNLFEAQTLAPHNQSRSQLKTFRSVGARFQNWRHRSFAGVGDELDGLQVTAVARVPSIGFWHRGVGFNQ